MKAFKGIWSEKPFQKQLYYLALMIVVSLSILSFIGSGLSYFLFDVNFFSQNEIQQLELSKENKYALMLMHFFSSIGIFLIPALIFQYTIKGEKILSNFLRKPNKTIIALCVAITIGLIPLVDLLQAWNNSWVLPDVFDPILNWFKKMDEHSKAIQNQFLDMKAVSDLFYNIFLMAMLPAFAEEMMFRGVLQPLFKQQFNNHHKAIWLTAFIFAAFHQQFYSVLPLFLMGGLLGYIKFWTQNIWYPIIIHFTNNCLMLFFVYFNLSNPNNWMFSLSLSVVAMVGIWSIFRLKPEYPT